APDFGRQGHLVHDQALGFGERLQGFLRVLAELAVDLPWREIGAVEKYLRLYDRRIDLVVGRRLALELRVVDRCRVQAESWTDKTGDHDQPGKQADHRQ